MMDAPNPSVHRVLLLRDAENPNVYKARPAYLAVGVRDIVRYINWTEGTVDLTFADSPFEEPTSGPIERGTARDLTVADKPKKRYPYVGRVNGVIIQGESSPEIIIDRAP